MGEVYTNAYESANANVNVGAHDVSQYAPYSMTGGAKKRPKKTKAKAKGSPKKVKAKVNRKIYVGPSGGQYYLRNNRKVYVC